MFVSSIHTQPGKLRCGNCRSLIDEPLAKSVVTSKFLFIEFAPEALAGLTMYDKIEVGNCWYNLKSLVLFDSFNVNHKSPHETKLGSNVGDERKSAIFQHNSKPMQT